MTRILQPAAGSLAGEAHRAARAGDYLAAHQALGRHFATRGRRWPVAAASRAELVDAIRLRFPDAAGDACRRADAVLNGRYDLLGYRELLVGRTPAWHTDVVHGRTAPRGYWADVPYLDPQSGDHKVIWEVNRHQHFLLLGAASWLSDRTEYRRAFVRQLQDWLRANPPLDGVNWASMLELAFRMLSWTWAVEFFCRDTESDETPWLVDLLVALDRQLVHVEQNLSIYFSPNTHISGEALALYAVSRAFPELGASARREALGRRLLGREAGAQIRADGGHAELSSHYHRYSTDFYLLANLVSRAIDDGDGSFEAPLRAQAAYLRTIADERGLLPHTGDEDGGQLFRFGGAAADDASPTLAAAAAVLADPALAVGQATPDVYWILGAAPPATPAHAAAWPSRTLADTGYVVFRRPEGRGHLVFDAGPHGFLNGGHAHADALSMVLTVAGHPLLVDAGMPTYTMDPDTRDRFRAPEIHNTVTIDGHSYARPRGAFHWAQSADARLLTATLDPGREFAVGLHVGYGFPIVRMVIAVADAGWLVVDYAALPRPARIETHWHLHPEWSALPCPAGFRLTHVSGLGLTLATTASLRMISTTDSWSPAYGCIEAAIELRACEDAATETALGTFVPVRVADGERTVSLASRTCKEGRTVFVFEIDGNDAWQVAVTVPPMPEALRPGSGWPQPCIEPRRTICVE
ncbi:MAG TPA: alginate lyase family protein [Vicinamibacterales bacterium]